MKEFKINGIISIPEDMTEYQFWGNFIDLIENKGWSYKVNNEVNKEISDLIDEINVENKRDIEEATKAYEEYIKNGEKSRPIEELEIPNEETIQAIEEMNKGIGLSKGFSSIEELMEDLLKEED